MRITRVTLPILALFASVLVMACTPSPVSSPAPEAAWQDQFDLADCNLVTTGGNEFFSLEPGGQLILEGSTLSGTREKLAITVLDETREVDGVLTRVVEEREWKNDEIVEVSRNFFAACQETGDVYYFGEEVDMYKGGQLASHQGAWLAGENDARAGIIMPGKPVVGMKYYQEVAPGVAMDRAEIISLDGRLRTPAGTFSNCLRTKEGTALNPLEQEFKIYAPGIGLIKDAELLLTGYSSTGLANTPTD